MASLGLRFALRGIFCACVILLSTSVLATADDSGIPAGITKLLSGNCVDCHSGESAEGDVRLDVISELNLTDRLELLNKVQEQVHFGHMPPADAEQLTSAERTLLTEWLSQDLQEHNASKLEQKLQRPEFGNYVDHDQLFSGKHADLPGFTYDRRWLISEFIFNDKFDRMLRGRTTWNYRGKRVTVFGGKRFHQLIPTNPFLLPTRTGLASEQSRR